MKLIWRSARRQKVVHMGDVDFFVEIYVKNPQLIIFFFFFFLEADMFRSLLQKLEKMLGFHVTVMDDREDFVTSERFPDADRLIKGSYDKLSDKKNTAYENAYYVIVTKRSSRRQCLCQTDPETPLYLSGNDRQ